MMLISPAYAQDISGMLGSAQGFLPVVLIFGVFYLLLIRPQQTRQKEAKAMIAAIKRGDRVVTGGGILGLVQKVRDNEVEVEIAPNVRVRLARSGIADVRTKGEPVKDAV